MADLSDDFDDEDQDFGAPSSTLNQPQQDLPPYINNNFISDQPDETSVITDSIQQVNPMSLDTNELISKMLDETPNDDINFDSNQDPPDNFQIENDPSGENEPQNDNNFIQLEEPQVQNTNDENSDIQEQQFNTDIDNQVDPGFSVEQNDQQFQGNNDSFNDPQVNADLSTGNTNTENNDQIVFPDDTNQEDDNTNIVQTEDQSAPFLTNQISSKIGALLDDSDDDDPAPEGETTDAMNDDFEGDDGFVDDEEPPEEPAKVNKPPTLLDIGTKPKIVRPNSRVRQTAPKPVVKPVASSDAGDSGIDLSDPQVHQAMSNLGISKRELAEPTDDDIHRYTRNPQFYEIVRNQYMKRRQRAIDAIEVERQRIADKEVSEARKREVRTQTQRTEALQAAENKQSFAEQESQRIQRIEDHQREETSRMILRILTEYELMKVAEVEKEQAVQRAHDLERETRRKNKEDARKRAQMAEANELKEKELRELREKQQVEAEAREAAFQERRAKAEAEQREENKRIEYERAMKNEKARQRAIDEEKRRQEVYLQQKADIERKERALQKRREEEARARKEKMAAEEKLRTERTIRREKAVSELMQQRRTTVDQKIALAETNYQILLEKRKQQLHEYQQINASRTMKVNRQRNDLDRERQENHEQRLAEQLKRSEEGFEARKKEQSIKRQELALSRQMEREDVKMRVDRATKSEAAQTKERQDKYEAHLREIARKEEQKRRQVDEANRIRRDLERKKEQAQSSGIASTQMRNANQAQLKDMADKFGLDYDDLRKQAEATAWRGKESRKPKPPQEVE